MKWIRRTGAALALFVLGLALAPAPALAQRYVASADSAYPRIKYADSLVSVNDRCMVTQRRLNTRMPAVYVNGAPMGFC